MSGPIKHNTTGLWVKKKPHPAQRAEKKSELIMNIHAAGGLNDCCFTGLWAVAKQFVRKEMAEKVSFLSTTPRPPPKFPNINVTDQQWTGLCVHKWIAKSQLQLFFFTPVYFFSLCQQICAEKLVFFFCVKWCSAEWQTNRAIAASAKAHFSILGVSFS